MTPVLLVYALTTRSASRVTTAGLAGGRLQRITVERIDAVVGEVARAPRPTARNLTAYDRIVTSLWEGNAAVLPARFGTAVHNRAELEFILRDRAKTLRDRLRIVRHRAQMTVRIVAPPSPFHLPPKPQSGRQFLELRAQTQRVPQFIPLRMAVRKWVKEERMQKEGRVATMYHLVPRAAVERYRKTMARAAEQAGVHAIVSGPWPPYAFAESW